MSWSIVHGLLLAVSGLSSEALLLTTRHGAGFSVSNPALFCVRQLKRALHVDLNIPACGVVALFILVFLRLNRPSFGSLRDMLLGLDLMYVS